MALIVLGLLLWSVPHLFKRLAPAARARMSDKTAKGGVAALVGLGLALMIWGFLRAPWVPLYDPPVWGRHLNNLLMLVAVALLGLGHSKSRLRGRIEHPMLWSVVVWAAAHLLANGDFAGTVLFAGLGLWALVSIALIGDPGPAHGKRPAPRLSLAGDIRLVVITLVVYAVIAAIHIWLGRWPFGGA